MDIDNNMCLKNVFYRQLTVPKNVPYAPQMNASYVLKDTHHNHGHHASTVLSCMLVTLRENVKQFNQTVQLIQTVLHALLGNAGNATQVTNLILNKNVFLNEQSL